MPTLFVNEHVVTALVNSFRKDITAIKNPNKSNIFLTTMFANILVRAFQDATHWPEVFVKVSLQFGFCNHFS